MKTTNSRTSPIYLDHAAATPIHPSVLKAMRPYFTEKFFNPSSLYLAAKEVKTNIQAARAKVAHQLGARPANIVFTAGGTEANNLAIHGVMRSFPEANLITSAIEHESVLKPAAKYSHKLTKMNVDGRIDIDDLLAKIDDNTVLVSIMYANNEIGTIQPIREIAKNLQFVREDRRKRGVKLSLYFHTDACQAANYLDLQVGRLGVDMMTLNGGKIYGPKQSGALYVASGLVLEPIIYGGGQEFGTRSGTENAPAIIGFATALERVQKRRHEEASRLAALRDEFTALVIEKIPSARVNGSTKHRLPNNLHVTIAGQDNERLLMQLDEKGIMAAAGSACSASDDEPSHVLSAIGVSDTEARASLRFTLGEGTSKQQIQKTATVLASCV